MKELHDQAHVDKQEKGEEESIKWLKMPGWFCPNIHWGGPCRKIQTEV